MPAHDADDRVRVRVVEASGDQPVMDRLVLLASVGLEAVLSSASLADVLVLFVPVVLAITGGRLSPAADVIALLAAMVVIALAGGLVPVLIWMTVAALVLFFLGFRAARRSRRAARTAAKRAGASRRPTGCGRSCSPRSVMTCAARSPRRRRR
jgi:hypothetical protein